MRRSKALQEKVWTSQYRLFKTWGLRSVHLCLHQSVSLLSSQTQSLGIVLCHEFWSLSFRTSLQFELILSSMWYSMIVIQRLRKQLTHEDRLLDVTLKSQYVMIEKIWKMIANSEEIAIWDTGESSREPTGSPKPSSEPASRELQHVASSRKDSEELRT